MSIRRLAALAAVVLLAPSASAQPADRLGAFGVVGSAAPERSLFPDATDPVLVVGVRLAPGLEAHLGARFDRRETLQAPRPTAPTPPPGDVFRREITDRTRAVTLGLRAQTGTEAVRLSLGASVALDAFDKTVVSYRVPTDPASPGGRAPGEVDARSTVYTHGGLSAVVAVPLAGGRIAPGLGLAASISGGDGSELGVPPARWMPFVSLPSTVALGSADVTLDARVGMARGAGSRSAQPRTWAPVVEAGLRVDL